ncbi:hypothetical protein [Microbispora rosea]|uniref:hypothetical protein n=1 Tax=Microbispora rosea TaxID=58117 RepID=UPI003D91E03A
MSLSVDVFITLEDGKKKILDVPEGVSDLAGHERTRVTLCGSPAVRALGARFLPLLAESDLWLEADVLHDLTAECETLLHQTLTIAAHARRRTGPPRPWWRGDLVAPDMGVHECEPRRFDP